MIEQFNAFLTSDFGKIVFQIFNALLEFFSPSNAPAATDVVIPGAPRG